MTSPKGPCDPRGRAGAQLTSRSQKWDYQISRDIKLKRKLIDLARQS